MCLHKTLLHPELRSGISKGIKLRRSRNKICDGIRTKRSSNKILKEINVWGQRVQELTEGLRLFRGYSYSYRCFFPKALSLQHSEIKLLPKKKKAGRSQQWHHWSQGNTLLLTKVVSSSAKTLRTCLEISLLFIDWRTINNIWSSTKTFISHCLQKLNERGKGKKKRIAIRCWNHVLLYI